MNSSWQRVVRSIPHAIYSCNSVVVVCVSFLIKYFILPFHLLNFFFSWIVHIKGSNSRGLGLKLSQDSQQVRTIQSRLFLVLFGNPLQISPNSWKQGNQKVQNNSEKINKERKKIIPDETNPQQRQEGETQNPNLNPPPPTQKKKGKP